MKILFCDDRPDDRRRWFDDLTAVWQDLRKKNVLAEELELQTCADITEAVGVPDSRTYTEVAGFDGVLLDILWDSQDPEHEEPHGIEIAEELHRRYPEKPVMAFTVSADAKYFHRLLTAGICGYLRKGEAFSAICFQIMECMDRHRRARGGHCLYKHLRELTSSEKGWAASSVGHAATEVWNLDRSHDRWDAFWNAFQGPIASQRLTGVFSKMREFFGTADLLMLGTLPGMRGHLDHVLNVYFTGYVISNRVQRFRQAAAAAAKRLFPDKQADVDANEPKYWERFQLAWLAAATLHDTGYPLEIQPDLLLKCWGITKQFEDVLSDTGKSPKPSCPDFSSTGLTEIGVVLGKLYDRGDLSGLVSNHGKFTVDSIVRLNHGVASGLLFLALAKKAIAVKDADPELDLYLKWAAAAMALHSLKKPGSEMGVSISLERDPLSFLLLACDEIQVWDRERPDASRMTSPFKGTDLSELSITDNTVTGCVDYVLHNGPAAGVEFATRRESMDKGIEADGQVLAKYLLADGFSVTVNRRVPSQEVSLAPLCF